jgi:hypothetical protein
MDRVGVEPTTSAPWQLSRLSALFIFYARWQQSCGKRTVLLKAGSVEWETDLTRQCHPELVQYFFFSPCRVAGCCCCCFFLAGRTWCMGHIMFKGMHLPVDVMWFLSNRISVVQPRQRISTLRIHDDVTSLSSFLFSLAAIQPAVKASSRHYAQPLS